MASPAARDHVLSNLGRCVIAIGILGLIRLVPESLSSGGNEAYYLLLINDAVLAGFAIGSGLGMHRGWKYGATLVAIGVGGASIVSLVGILIYLIPELLRGSRILVVFAPRLGFYAISLAFWPYGIRGAFKAIPQAGSRRWILLVGSAASSAAILASVILLDRRG